MRYRRFEMRHPRGIDISYLVSNILCAYQLCSAKGSIGICWDVGTQCLPPGGRCPEGADEEWRNLKFDATVGIMVQHLGGFREIGMHQ